MDKYVELLKKWDGEFEDLCYELYEMLQKEEEKSQAKIFQNICELVESIDSDRSKKISTYFGKGEINSLKATYGKYVDEVINTVRKKIDSNKLSATQFYELLWDTLEKSQILFSTKEKAFGLLWILADNGIPYYELGDSVTMENEEYKEIVDDNIQAIKKIEYILSVPFEQRTQVASLILEEILKKDDYRIRAVLLAQALKMYSQKDNGQIKKFLEMLKNE